MDLLGPQTDILNRLLSAAALRSRVLASNVANQNTPGYRRREVEFEARLAEELKRSSPHLAELRPEVKIDLETPARSDGNSVDMESEVSAARENRLLFELYADILQGRTRVVELAIREGR